MRTMLSRRQTLTSLPALAAGVGAAAGAAGAVAVAAPAAAATVRAADRSPGTLGFTIGSFTENGSNLSQLLSDLDHVAALGGTGIRIDFGAAHLIGSWGGDTGQLSLDTRSVAQMHTLLDRAAELGLLVYVMLISHYDDNPGDAHDPSDEVWLTKTEQWWRAIAREFGSEIAIVQVFNEATGYHYRRFEAVAQEDRPAYRRDLAEKIGRCRDIVHEEAPGVLVTHNIYGWPVSDWREEIWYEELDDLADSMDLITVDAFVDFNDTGWETMNGLLDRVKRLEEAYGKQVAIGEFGVSTAGRSYEEQADRLQVGVEVMTSEESTILIGFLFRLRHKPSYSAHESQFGIIEQNSVKKTAYHRIDELRLS